MATTLSSAGRTPIELTRTDISLFGQWYFSRSLGFERQSIHFSYSMSTSPFVQLSYHFSVATSPFLHLHLYLFSIATSPFLPLLYCYISTPISFLLPHLQHSTKTKRDLNRPHIVVLEVASHSILLSNWNSLPFNHHHGLSSTLLQQNVKLGIMTCFPVF